MGKGLANLAYGKLSKRNSRNGIEKDFENAYEQIHYKPTHQANLLEMSRLSPKVLEETERLRRNEVFLTSFWGTWICESIQGDCL